MKEREIKGNSAVLLGYGREGKSTHEYLIRKHPGLKIGIADQKPVDPIDNTRVKLHTGENYMEDLTDYDTIIRSPGIPANTPELRMAQEQGKWITSETNIFFSECQGKIIGVTGTKGKSTTASLIYEIVSSQYPDTKLVGNIGNPTLDSLSNDDSDTVFVAELSSSQLEDVRYSPGIAVVLEIVPEHLNHHGDFNSYLRAKANIVRYQSETDVVVFNPSYLDTSKAVELGKGRQFRFSTKKAAGIDCYIENGQINILKDGEVKSVIGVDDIPLMGRGNLENVLAAISVGFLMNVSLYNIREAVKRFKPLQNRLEFVQEKLGITFYNDSLATTPEAVVHALEALGENVETLIAGGYDRGLDFSNLGRFLSQRSIKTLILFPDTGKAIWEEVIKHTDPHNRPQMYEVTNMQEAVNIAFRETSPGKICVLSPGAASFNLFKDYEDRGSQFKKYITERN